MTRGELLSGDWFEGYDAARRKHYYSNMKTNVVQWEFPEELLSDKTIVNRPKYWIESFDPKENKPYFFNRWTRETRWDLPSDQCQTFQPTESVVEPIKVTNNTTTKTNAFAALRNLEQDKTEKANVQGREIEFDNTPSVSQYNGVKDVSTSELTERSNGKTMTQYAEMHFLVDRKGIFSSRTTIEKLMSWKKDLIKHPLTIIGGDIQAELSKDCVQIFKNITGYMGDRSSRKTPTDHALKIILLGLSSPQCIRDEIFCQVCKQTTHNPNPVSLEKGWYLFLILLTSYAPSANLIDFLSSHCTETMSIYQESHPNIAMLAETTLHKIHKSSLCSPRCELPTVMEMDAILRGVSIKLRIYLIDGSYIVVNADSWLSVRECEENIAIMLGLSNQVPFGLFEQTLDGDERKLNPTDRVLDIMSVWAHIELESVANNEELGDTDTYYFLYKVRYYIDLDYSDKNGIELMYRQAVHDVINCVYLCTSEDSYILAALQMQEEYGDYSDGVIELKNKLHMYLPARHIDEAGPAVTLPIVLARYVRLVGYTREECRLSYIDFVKSFPSYGAAYFFVNTNSNLFPSEIVIAINAVGLRLLDNITKEYLDQFKFEEITSWGHSSGGIVLTFGSKFRIPKIHLLTKEAAIISEMMHVYVANKQNNIAIF